MIALGSTQSSRPPPCPLTRLTCAATFTAPRTSLLAPRLSNAGTSRPIIPGGSCPSTAPGPDRVVADQGRRRVVAPRRPATAVEGSSATLSEAASRHPTHRLTDLIDRGLRDRGADEVTAFVTRGLAVTVSSVVPTRWLDRDGETELAVVVGETPDALRAVMRDVPT